MLLCYFDESGINFRYSNGLYDDGQCIIFGCILINEHVYWHVERMFCELIKEYFDIENPLLEEIHATNIWQGEPPFNKCNEETRRKFFDEFVQMISKFKICYICSFELKDCDNDIISRNMAYAKSATCLLTTLEHTLSYFNETGILICDETQNCNNLSYKNIRDIDEKTISLDSSQVMFRQFHAMTSWRTQSHDNSLFILEPKYTYESKSAYLLDRIHFVSSDDSIFIQIVDILNFILQRCFTWDYLLNVDSKNLDVEKLPINIYAFNLLLQKNIIFTFYQTESEDVQFAYESELPYDMRMNNSNILAISNDKSFIKRYEELYEKLHN